MFTKLVRGVLVGILILFVSCNLTTTTEDNGDNQNGGEDNPPIVKNLELSLNSITGIRNVAVGDGKIYLGGFVQDEDGIPYLKVVAIDGEGNPVTSLTANANWFLNKIKYDPQSKKLFIGGSSQTGINGYGFLLAVTAPTLQIYWSYSFGSDIENRYFEVNDFAVWDNKIYLAGYGSANYAIYVRYVGRININGNQGSGDILDSEPGGVNSSYSAVTIFNGQVWMGGESWALASSDPDEESIYTHSCYIAHYEGDTFYEKNITGMAGVEGKFCSGIFGMGSDGDQLVVVGTMADSPVYDVIKTKPTYFVGIYNSGSFKGVYPVEVSEVAGMDFIVTGYDVRGGKVLLVGYAHDDNTGNYYSVVVKVEYNTTTGSFEGKGSLVTNCTQQKGAKCEIYDVKFIDDTTFIVAGDLDYKGYVFSAKW